MSNLNKHKDSSSRLPLLNEHSDHSFSSLSFVDDESCGDSENELKSVGGRISLNPNVDLSILVHLSDSEKEQSDSKLDRKNAAYPAYFPGFIIKVHNIAGSLRRNSISLPTGLNDRALDSLRFRSHIPDGGKELEDINKSCASEVIKKSRKTASVIRTKN